MSEGEARRLAEGGAYSTTRAVKARGSAAAVRVQIIHSTGVRMGEGIGDTSTILLQGAGAANLSGRSGSPPKIRGFILNEWLPH